MASSTNQHPQVRTALVQGKAPLRLRGRLAKACSSAVFGLGLSFLSVASTACHSKTSVTVEAPVPAVLGLVVQNEAPPSLVRRGQVQVGSRLRLGFAAGGEVAQVYVRVGQKVREGQVLARLRTHDLAVHQRAAKAARVRAAAEHEAATRLAEGGSIAALEQVRANTALEMAEAQEEVAKKAMSHAKLVAPVSGVVFEKLVQPGEVVGPGMPVVIVDETDRLVVRVGVSEKDLARVATNQVVTMVGEAGVTVAGRVTSVSPSPNPADGLYAVEVAPEGQGSKDLRSGLSMDVRFAVADKERQTTIPSEALAYRNGKVFAFVLQDGPESRAVAREVTIEPIEGATVVVRAGLRAGDRIVREGVQFLMDGQPVRVLPTMEKSS